MTIPVVQVFVTANDPGRRPIAGATVTAKLSEPMVSESLVIPLKVSALTDDRGVCALYLVPNSVGQKPTTYTFVVSVPGQFKRTYYRRVVVPDVGTVGLERLLGGSPASIDINPAFWQDSMTWADGLTWREPAQGGMPSTWLDIKPWRDQLIWEEDPNVPPADLAA
jgi:hypothetical protein